MLLPLHALNSQGQLRGWDGTQAVLLDTLGASCWYHSTIYWTASALLWGGGQARVKPCCPLLLLGYSPTLWKRARYLYCSGPRDLGSRLGSDIFAKIGQSDRPKECLGKPECIDNVQFHILAVVGILGSLWHWE